MDAWRPALRILEHAWGRPKETVEVHDDTTLQPVDKLSLGELFETRQRLIAAYPELASDVARPHPTPPNGSHKAR